MAYALDDKTAIEGVGRVELVDKSTCTLIFIYLWYKVPKQDIIWGWSFVVPYPFSFDTEEDPHPSPNNFQEFHQEYSTLEIIEVI